MPRIITHTVFTYDELSDRAKDVARAWFREASAYDEWWDTVYDDAKQCADILGIGIYARNQKCFLTGSKPREWIDRSPAIFFSGFSSQGDGACFEGTYHYAKGASKKIRKHAPLDTKLHRIADELKELQRKHSYRLTATMKHSGHYSHSGCMSVRVDDSRFDQDQSEASETLAQLMRDFADWIYSLLEKEYEWRNADEQVDENILANEYTFDADGNRDG